MTNLEPTVATQTLYRFWDADDVLLYVGITADPLARWKSHQGEKPWWLDVKRVTVEHFATRAEVDTAETAAIRTEKPRYNVAKRSIRRRTPPKPVVAAAGYTHAGHACGVNSDSLYVGGHLAVVADGITDRPHADVASATVIEALRSCDRRERPKGLVKGLSSAVYGADATFRAKIAEHPHLQGMASTLAAMLWSGHDAVVAHVGNSRIYRYRDGKTAPVTDDHMLGRLLGDVQPINAKQLVRLVEGLGPDGSCYPDVVSHRLQLGDRYLLCSDGLSTYVPADQIHAVLTGEPGTAEAAERLVDLALDRGGIDNVTVIVIDVG